MELGVHKLKMNSRGNPDELQPSPEGDRRRWPSCFVGLRRPDGLLPARELPEQRSLDADLRLPARGRRDPRGGRPVLRRLGGVRLLHRRAKTRTTSRPARSTMPQPRPQGIGNWTASANPYPLSVTFQSCVTASGYVYCVGGTHDSTGDDTAASYYAPLSPAGVGSWAAGTPYPVATDALSCVGAVGDIYCVGGENETTGTNSTTALSRSGLVRPRLLVRHRDLEPRSRLSGQSLLPQLLRSGRSYIYCVGGEDAQDNPQNATYYSVRHSLWHGSVDRRAGLPEEHDRRVVRDFLIFALLRRRPPERRGNRRGGVHSLPLLLGHRSVERGSKLSPRRCDGLRRQAQGSSTASEDTTRTLVRPAIATTCCSTVRHLRRPSGPHFRVPTSVRGPLEARTAIRPLPACPSRSPSPWRAATSPSPPPPAP